MPRAYTPQEKKAINDARLAEQAQPVVRENHERDVEQKTRRTRGAFNGTQGKLSVLNYIAGYHLHWVNDTPGRITTALDNGYEFVTNAEVGKTGNNIDLSENIKHLVGTQESGEPLHAYLMKIREDWYEEDQAAQQGRIDKVDSAIKNGRIGQDTDGFYKPVAGISVKNSNSY